MLNIVYALIKSLYRTDEPLGNLKLYAASFPGFVDITLSGQVQVVAAPRRSGLGKYGCRRLSLINSEDNLTYRMRYGVLYKFPYENRS